MNSYLCGMILSVLGNIRADFEDLSDPAKDEAFKELKMEKAIDYVEKTIDMFQAIKEKAEELENGKVA